MALLLLVETSAKKVALSLTDSRLNAFRTWSGLSSDQRTLYVRKPTGSTSCMENSRVLFAARGIPVLPWLVD